MKKIIFSIFILVLATVVGCQKSDIAENKGAQKITVTATIDSAEQTRVALTPDTNGEGKPIVKVAWNNEGESFRVCGWDENPNYVTDYETFTQVSGNQFTGSVPENAGGYYIATYPASDLIEGQTSPFLAVKYDKTVFTSQNGKLSEDRTVMYATPETIDNDTNFNFWHITTLLMPRFRIRGESQNLPANKIASITFKDMFVPDGTADFNIDCSSHNEGDDIYVYLPETENGSYGSSDFSFFQLKSTIEIIVNTTDAKTYEGSLTIPNGTILESGKLYTANFWLDPKVETNVITYTTDNNTKITLDDSYWKIDGEPIYSSHTFESGIGKITLIDGITSIPEYGFYTEYQINNLELPSVITSIGGLAFAGCNKLVSINLRNVTSIGSWAFQNCTSLSEIIMPITEFTIGDNCFASCGVTEVDLSNAKSVDSWAFLGCNKLKTVTINRLEPPTFGEYDSFKYCDNLESIYVPLEKVSVYQAILPDVSTKIKAIP